MKFHAVYCWRTPDLELLGNGSPLVPMVRLWINNKQTADQLARQHIDRFGPAIEAAGRWCFGVQPPLGGLESVFGPIYDHETGQLHDGADRLEAYVQSYMAALEGWFDAPCFMPLDIEGYPRRLYYTGAAIQANRRAYEAACNRSHMIRRCIVNPVLRVCGRWIDHSNYWDMPGLSEPVVDHNGWEVPPQGLSSIASPVRYIRLDRRQHPPRTWHVHDVTAVSPTQMQSLIGESLCHDIQACEASGIECVPWLADEAYGGDDGSKVEPSEGRGLIWLANQMGVQRFSLWDAHDKEQATQRWIVEQGAA
jgi:hypothetical protein